MQIKNCPAIITGAASGLGEATARALAEAGARVAIFDMNREQGERLADAVGGVFASVDVTAEDSLSEGLELAAARHGEARILVNCAGVILGQKTLKAGTPHALDDFQRIVLTNLVGTFNSIRLVATRMAALAALGGERGVIVNTASVAAFDGQAGQAAYAASKAGVVGMTLPIARDLSGDAIRVMTIAPGIFNTPMMAALPDKVQQGLAASVPFPPRLGEPAEYAALVRHICENRYFNGETIRLDGAVRMQAR